MAFNGDVCRDLAAHFLTLAEKQGAKVPLMIGHFVMATTLLLRGIPEAREHYDQAIVLYDPMEHRPLATRFGQDIRVTILSFRSRALWLLGCPDAALADVDQALKDARDIDQAASLMFALDFASFIRVCSGNYAAANVAVGQLVDLADEKGAWFWKALGMLYRGSLSALTGKASEAVQMITSGLAALRSTGALVWVPWYLSYLAKAYAELGQFDDAARCVNEAMTAMETTKEKWCEAEVHRRAGEIALMSPERDAAKAQRYFERAIEVSRQQQAKVLGTPRRNEPRTPLARPGQGAASARTAGSGLRVVHGGVRHARSEGGEGAAGGVGGVTVC